MAKKTKAASKATASKPAKHKAGKAANGSVKAVEAAVPETAESLPAEAGPKFGATEPPTAAEPKPAKRGRSAISAVLSAKKLSALDAAAKVLGETNTAMTTQEMIDAMAAKGYWTSPGGATPAATLYAAILREQKVKGKEARFVKTERGKFALSGAGKCGAP